MSGGAAEDSESSTDWPMHLYTMDTNGSAVEVFIGEFGIVAWKTSLIVVVVAFLFNYIYILFAR